VIHVDYTNFILKQTNGEKKKTRRRTKREATNVYLYSQMRWRMAHGAELDAVKFLFIIITL